MVGRAAIASWGPAAWTFMHTVSFTYPEHPNADDKERAHRFMHACAAMLPCIRCRRDWTHYVTEHLPTVDSRHLLSREAFARFLVEGHNHVNRRLNKPTLTYEEVFRMYTIAASTASFQTRFVLLVTVIVGVTIFLLRRRRKDSHTAIPQR